MSIPRPEYPRPHMVRDAWLNLNGPWEFERDPGKSGVARGLPGAERLKETITVPFCPESKLSGIGDTDFMPCVWYRKAFRVPEENWAGMNILLHFGAVDYFARVWVNGQEVGTHRGGYSPFSFDITSALKAGENVITLCAEDDTRHPLQPRGKQSEEYASHGCDYTRTTGIWQTVWLEPVPKQYIKRLRIVPNLSIDGLRVDVSTSEADGALAELVVYADGQQVARMTGGVVGDLAMLGAHLSKTRVWSPEDPFLYDVEVTLHAKDGTIDRVTSYAGMRSLGIRGPALLLNGKPKFQRLVLDQGFYPDGIYTAPTDEDLKKDIEISMGLGFDGARLHMRVFEPRFLYWADKLGYLVWGEYPNWGLDVSNAAALPRVLGEWLEIMDRDISHPSIVGWCPFNETFPAQDPDVLRMVYRATKAADPTRPCIDTSGYVHVGETDVYDSHNYDQNPATFAEAFKPMLEGGDVWRNHPESDAPWRGEPYFVSEYGGNLVEPGSAGWESLGLRRSPEERRGVHRAVPRPDGGASESPDDVRLLLHAALRHRAGSERSLHVRPQAEVRSGHHSRHQSAEGGHRGVVISRRRRGGARSPRSSLSLTRPG